MLFAAIAQDSSLVGVVHVATWIVTLVTVVAMLAGLGALLFAPILAIATHRQDVDGLRAWGRRLVVASLGALVLLLLAQLTLSVLVPQL